MARACSTLGRLARGLNGKQLLLTLRASVRPLVQVNIDQKFWRDTAQTSKRTDLPDNLHHRIALTMLPDAAAESIRNKSSNSPTRLLAATLAFYILKHFGQGMTQRNMQELYEVKPNRWPAASRVESIWVGQNDAQGKEKHLVKSLPPAHDSEQVTFFRLFSYSITHT